MQSYWFFGVNDSVDFDDQAELENAEVCFVPKKE